MMKNNICETYEEAKKHRREFVKDGLTYSIVPPYKDIIEGVDYGEKDPQPVLMPAMIVGK